MPQVITFYHSVYTRKLYLPALFLVSYVQLRSGVYYMYHFMTITGHFVYEEFCISSMEKEISICETIKN